MDIPVPTWAEYTAHIAEHLEALPEAREIVAETLTLFLPGLTGHALTRARPAQNPHNPGGAPLVRSCATGGGSP
jgi:hypothetical protein